MYKTFIVKYKDAFKHETLYEEVEAFDEENALREFWKFKTILESKALVILSIFEIAKIIFL